MFVADVTGVVLWCRRCSLQPYSCRKVTSSSTCANVRTQALPLHLTYVAPSASDAAALASSARGCDVRDDDFSLRVCGVASWGAAGVPGLARGVGAVKSTGAGPPTATEQHATAKAMQQRAVTLEGGSREGGGGGGAQGTERKRGSERK